MIRHHQILPFLSAIVAASLAPAAHAAGRPARDTGMACARADNMYCRVADVERFEINEAFAAVPLAAAAELGLPHDIINVNVGAIAHGHPIGATGAVLTTRPLHSTHTDGIRPGIVTLCIGGGQGIALAVEVR